MSKVIWKRRLVKSLIPVLYILEKLYFERLKSKELAPIVFIIGVPRSGTTYIYQKITNSGDYHFINNMIQYLSKSAFIAGNWLSSKILSYNHGCFKSVFGNTYECGLKAPNEGARYWQKVRSKDNYLRAVQDLNTIYSLVKKPLIIKNLYNTVYLKELIDNFPHAKFLVIDRNKQDTIKSIKKARSFYGIKNSEFWSATPLSMIQNQYASEEKLLSDQYDLIVSETADLLSDFPGKLVIRYEDFLTNTEQTLESIHTFIFQN